MKKRTFIKIVRPGSLAIASTSLVNLRCTLRENRTDGDRKRNLITPSLPGAACFYLRSAIMNGHKLSIMPERMEAGKLRYFPFTGQTMSKLKLLVNP